MSSEENTELSTEDRLRGLAYQFLKLYERWSEDRQTLNANMSYQADMIKKFADQLKDFEGLELQVRRNLVDSIQQSTKVVSKEIGEKVSDAASLEIKKTVEQLQKAVNNASEMVYYYQSKVRNNFFVTISVTIITAVTASLLAVWLVMPEPVLPLTDKMLDTYFDGVFIKNVWPKLPEKMRKDINNITLKNFNESPPLPISINNN